MTNEIKEILDDLDYCKNLRAGNILLKYNECDLLLDYITSLQQRIDKVFEKLDDDYILKNGLSTKKLRGILRGDE